MRGNPNQAHNVKTPPGRGLKGVVIQKPALHPYFAFFFFLFLFSSQPSSTFSLTSVADYTPCLQQRPLYYLTIVAWMRIPHVMTPPIRLPSHPALQRKSYWKWWTLSKETILSNSLKWNSNASSPAMIDF